MFRDLSIFLCRSLITGIGKTLRIKIKGTYTKRGVIYAFWHSQFFPLVYAYRNRNITVLVSEHGDGENLAKIIAPFGYRTTIAVLKLSKPNKDDVFAIAPDGPRGPREKVKDGIIKIAQWTGFPIVPVKINISRKIVFKSWDRFNLPIMGSRCEIIIKEPIIVTNNIEEVKRKIEKSLS